MTKMTSFSPPTANSQALPRRSGYYRVFSAIVGMSSIASLVLTAVTFGIIALAAVAFSLVALSVFLAMYEFKKLPLLSRPRPSRAKVTFQKPPLHFDLPYDILVSLGFAAFFAFVWVLVLEIELTVYSFSVIFVILLPIFLLFFLFSDLYEWSKIGYS